MSKSPDVKNLEKMTHLAFCEVTNFTVSACNARQLTDGRRIAYHVGTRRHRFWFSIH